MTAVLDALSESLRPGPDSRPLVLAFLQQVATLTGARQAALWLGDAQALRCIALWPPDDSGAPEVSANGDVARGADGHHLVSRAAATGEPASDGHQHALPIRIAGDAGGVLWLDRLPVPPDMEAVRWIETVGRFVIVSALNAYEVREARRRAQRHELLLNLATLPDLALEAGPILHPGLQVRDEKRSAGRTPEMLAGLEGSFQHLAGVIATALEVETAGFLFLDPETEHLVPFGQSGKATALGGADVIPDALRRVFRHGRVYRVATGESDTKGHALLRRLQARSLVAVPILVESEPRGVFYVAANTVLDEQDVAFVVVLAARIGLLVERAELTQLRHQVERQRAQAAARQEFLGIVTHELKTPVAVMQAYTELLIGRAEKAGRDEECELLRRIDDQAHRMLSMVDQVLDLQRLDAGLFPLEIGTVAVDALAARVLEGLQLTAGDVRLRLTAEPHTRVRADRRRIEQVLTNLVQNAIRFAPPKSEVLVSIRSSPSLPELSPEVIAEEPHRLGPWVLVSVSDEGRGVADADRRRIFDRFYQGKGGDTLHRGHGGLGIGLYIAREIVSRHGGVLWLEPRPDHGKGATFTFALPPSAMHDEEQEG
jgi:signal transduction histidine kinase